MNLYKVTCIDMHGHGLDVYVIARDESGAAHQAIERMRELEYRYDNHVGKVELIAGADRYHAPSMLIGGESE